jgi:hypothetical protein
MMKSLKILSASVALAGALVAGAASAQTFTYDWNGGGISTSNYGGRLTDWIATYDNTGAQKTLAMTARFGSEVVTDDGFWLVLNAGGNPKAAPAGVELAILYGDLRTNRITAYQYNRQNDGNSFQGRNALQVWDNAFSFSNVAGTGQNQGRGYSFLIDVTALNSINTISGWRGAQFGTDIGIWFHPTANGVFTYAANGNITGIGGGYGWFDTDRLHTTRGCPSGQTLQPNGQCGTTTVTCPGGTRPLPGGGCGTGSSSGPVTVSEPRSIALFGLGLLAAGFMTRRRRAA